MAGLNGASSALSNQQGGSFYGGPLYAQLNPQQQAALAGLNQFAGTTGANTSSALTGTGAGAVGALNQGINGAQTILNNATTNQTGQNITNATQYANNPTVEGMIRAANTPIQQNLTMGTLPGLYGAAAQTGNTDSSRTGTQAAIQNNLASTAEANNAATIEGNAYNNGLNLSNNAYGTGLYAGMGAANSLTGAASTGANMAGSGYQMGVNNANIPLQTGTALQQNQQNIDQAGLQQWQGQLNYPWQVLQNYMGIAGNPNMLGTTGYSNSSGTQTGGGPGLLGGLLGAATGIGSLFMPTGAFGQGASMFSSLTGGLGNLFGGSPVSGNYGGGGL